jgi:hypothetical protein
VHVQIPFPMAIGISRSKVSFFGDTIGSESEMGAEDKIGIELNKIGMGEELPEIFKEPLFRDSD